MPVLAVGGGGYIPILGDNVTMPTAIYGTKTLAQNVQGAAGACCLQNRDENHKYK